jgi:uncharacterized protein
MLFVLICKDKPDSLQLRVDTRPAHLGYLEGLNERGALKAAGPFLDADGKPNGSLVIVEAADREAAAAIAAADPFALAGLFAEVEIRAWNWVLNKPEQV